MSTAVTIHPSSYRDPSGFIFEKEGDLYRQVNISYKEHFDHFIKSGCYKHLVKKDWLIQHEQISENLTGDINHYATLKPEKLSFISYPYEWSFDMLKDAALLTLQLAREVLDFEMMLKDATPYNVQWHKGRFVFIDTLSFEKFTETPWIAYRQFCETFLGPLLLMHYSKQPLHALQLAWPDGIPLQVTKSLLPNKSRFSFHTYLHIHLHSKISSRQQGNQNFKGTLVKKKFLDILSSLEILVHKLKLPEQASTWIGYYEEASKRDNYLEAKKSIIKDWLKQMGPILKTGADIGANQGEFSGLMAELNIETISADFDAFCINRLYLSIKKNNQKNIQPIIQDFSIPSPAIGVNNEERASFLERINVDITLALALIHHLAIGKNIKLPLIAALFSKITRYLVIEFVPATDEKALFMISQKNHPFGDYSQENFESSFKNFFTVERQEVVPDSQRTLYLLKKK